MKVVAQNKKALFDYQLLDKKDAGIVLEGWEVKSIKSGKISLAGSFIKEKNGELSLVGATVSKWKYGVEKSKAQLSRERKLLLKKREITTLGSKVKEQGCTIIPVDVFINNAGMIKLTLALAKGKKKFDKRDSLRRKDQQRRIDLDRKQHNF